MTQTQRAQKVRVYYDNHTRYVEYIFVDSELKSTMYFEIKGDQAEMCDPPEDESNFLATVIADYHDSGTSIEIDDPITGEDGNGPDRHGLFTKPTFAFGVGQKPS